MLQADTIFVLASALEIERARVERAAERQIEKPSDALAEAERDLRVARISATRAAQVLANYLSEVGE